MVGGNDANVDRSRCPPQQRQHSNHLNKHIKRSADADVSEKYRPYCLYSLEDGSVSLTDVDNIHLYSNVYRILLLPSCSNVPRSPSVYLSTRAYLPRAGKMLEGADVQYSDPTPIPERPMPSTTTTTPLWLPTTTGTHTPAHQVHPYTSSERHSLNTNTPKWLNRPQGWWCRRCSRRLLITARSSTAARRCTSPTSTSRGTSCPARR